MSKVILLTGASGGFGRLTASTLLARGHRVVATMRDPNGRNAIHAQSLQNAGAFVVEMDVTIDASVETGVAAALDAMEGRLDVVINNAGAGAHGIQECFTAEDWQRVFDLNVFGVARVNRAVLPQFRARGAGLLMHVSSLLGRIAIPFYGPYSASKWALEALAETYRAELAPAGIDCVIVEPGGYNTAFSSHSLHPGDDDRAASYAALGLQPAAALAGFQALVGATPQQDPQRVAEAMAMLIDMPPGQRPFRTTVDFIGMGLAVDPYNRMLESVQRSLYGNMGVAHLLDRNSPL